MDDLSESAGTGPLRVRRVHSLEDLRALQPAWDEVLAGAETATPFLSHEWVVSWWESFGESQELDVLVVEDDLGPAAIAPFARVQHAAGPLRYRALQIVGTGSLRFLGMGLSDRSDLLLARRRTECASVVLGTLAAEKDRWDVVDLRFLPEGSTTAQVFAERSRDLGIGIRWEPCSDSPFLPLDGTWSDYLSRRGKRFRSGLARRLRRLESRGTARFDLGAGRTDPSGALRAAREVTVGSWKGRAGSALLLHANVRSFLERLLPRLASRDRLYLALLTVDGTPAAHELGFRFGSRLWSYDSAFRGEYGEGSPGTLLTAKLLEEAWSEGLTGYEFLRGGEGYKLSWSAEIRREVQMVLDSGSLRGRAASDLVFRVKWTLKRNQALVRAQGRLAGMLNRIAQGRNRA